MSVLNVYLYTISAQQLGIYSQRDWTNFIDKTKYNQLVDDSALEFEKAQAVNLEILAKQAQLQPHFSQLKN